jgi:carbamoyl-phosphate synthase large subunit
MRYISTRGQAPALSFEEVVLTGMASDGGLYVPETLPEFSKEELADMAGLSYAEIAFRVMKPFVNGEIDDETFRRLVTEAYATFNHDAVVPLKQLDASHFLLEQFHGPTLAFKDVALQLLGRLLDHFLSAAVEVDIDAVSDGQQVVIGGIMQHVEQAGVHSGDSACALPPYSLPADVQDEMREQVKKMAVELGVKGLMNVQLAWQDGEIYVIEVNPRASRTVPFVSKCIGTSLAQIAARCMAGKTLAEQGFEREIVPHFYSVKEAVFPFNKFQGVDPILSPEMKSTGEVMGSGDTFAEAFFKAQLGAGEAIPALDGDRKAFLSVREPDKQGIIEVARSLLTLGFTLCATRGTAAALEAAGLPVEHVNKVYEGRPHIVDLLKNDEIAYIVNTTEGRQAINDSSIIRRTALARKVPYATTLAGANAVCMALEYGREITVRRLQDLHAGASQ